MTGGFWRRRFRHPDKSPGEVISADLSAVEIGRYQSQQTIMPKRSALLLKNMYLPIRQNDLFPGMKIVDMFQRKGFNSI